MKGDFFWFKKEKFWIISVGFFRSSGSRTYHTKEICILGTTYLTTRPARISFVLNGHGTATSWPERDFKKWSNPIQCTHSLNKVVNLTIGCLSFLGRVGGDCGSLSLPQQFYETKSSLERKLNYFNKICSSSFLFLFFE